MHFARYYKFDYIYNIRPSQLMTYKIFRNNDGLIDILRRLYDEMGKELWWESKDKPNWDIKLLPCRYNTLSCLYEVKITTK